MTHIIKTFFLSLTLLLLPFFAHATMRLELTQGIDSAIPIAIVPFVGQSAVSEVISQDLHNSGRFNPLDDSRMMEFPHSADKVDRASWKKNKVNYVVVGQVEQLPGDQYQVKFSLIDVYARAIQGHAPASQGLLASQSFTADSHGLRALSHHISDIIYEKILKQRGIFSTKIVYVAFTDLDHYQLQVADYDGYNPQKILTSTRPIMSPHWSPDGKSLAYVSFEEGNSSVYIHELATGHRKLITSFPGINGAPSFSPDGKKLALVLTLSGMPNVYLKDLVTGDLTRLTNEDAINTEPVFMPDGKSLLYTSDRGGSPQIYQLDLATKKSTRVTYNGRYNASPSITQDGKSLVVLHRAERGAPYSIAIQDMASGRLQILADPPITQSPSVAPNGAMVVFSFQNPHRVFLLGMVSTDGRVRLNLPSTESNIREPSWSPFL